MRNVNIRECKNGWLLEINGYFIGQELEHAGHYVFSDWSEMMEFVEDYFADEEE